MLSSIGDCDVIVIVQEEYPVVLCWALWAIVMAVVQLVLCFVSSFTVLRYPYDCSPTPMIIIQCVFSQVHSSETLFAHRVLSSCSLGRLRHGPGIESSDMKMRCEYKNVQNGFRYCLDVIGKISHGNGLGIASSDISGGNKNF